MARKKSFKIVAVYNMPKGKKFYINDLGTGKSTRFELYDESMTKPLQKSNNPLDFDEYVLKGS